MQEIIQQAGKTLSSITPSFILAEEGCDLSALITALTQADFFRCWPQLMLDCAQISDSSWNTLLKKEHSPLNENHRILIVEHPEKLSAVQQQQWLEYIHVSRLHTRCKLIYTLSPAAQETLIWRSLLTSNCFTFRVPPLRERKNELPILASLLVGHFNYRFSRQIIGFDPDAMKALTQYPWPGNSAQFYRVLQQLSATCNGGTVSSDAVYTALADEKRFYAAPLPDKIPQGTLEEMTRQIVWNVLSEEKMNKTKAAQRLGIGRTTLWRILAGSDFPANQSK